MAMLDKKVLEHSDYKKHPLEIWTKEWTDLRIALATLPRYSDHRLLAGLWDLLLRPWFQRVWVLQEVAYARVATVVCGTQSVSSRTFAIMPTLLNRPSSTGSHTDEHAKAVIELMPGPMRRESWYSEGRKLATLLQKFQDSKASIPLDRVYALLGISSDAWNFRHFPVDYSITMRALLRNTMSFFLYGKVVRDPRNHGERISAEYAVTVQLPAWNLAGLIDILEMPGPFWAYVFDWAVGLFEFTLIEGLVATGVFDASIDIRECHVNSITVLAFRVMTDLQDQLLDGTLDGGTYAFLDGLLVGKTLDERTHAFLDGLSFLPGQHSPY
ncbi:heterokaryon incompatibility protein-domain-containing protein [Apiospora marii]|uniref:Heterokaryon incompatibility protein-domain-containing protein n=2 Tax=Apiospora marii TaxID=335849 RepID=A0ABR1R4R0_9PEZI